MVPAHRFRAFDNKDAALGDRLEIGGALHGPQLPDVQDRPGHRVFQPYGIGDDCPHIRMGFQHKWHSLYGCRVGAFSPHA